MDWRKWSGGALLALAGCGIHVEYTELNAPPRPLAPRAPESVEVYASAAPARPHVDVGLFEVEQESSNTPGKTRALLDELRRRAGAIGCDAVVVAGITAKNSELESLLLDYDTNKKALQATCIVYTAPPPAPVTAQPQSVANQAQPAPASSP